MPALSGQLPVLGSSLDPRARPKTRFECATAGLVRCNVPVTATTHQCEPLRFCRQSPTSCSAAPARLHRPRGIDIASRDRFRNDAQLRIRFFFSGVPNMNLRHGGQILVDQLAIQGCDTVFCVPGESYLAALDGLADHGDIRTIICRQEGGAAIMAEAYGKMTGKPGVCFVTRGPGATNASPGFILPCKIPHR